MNKEFKTSISPCAVTEDELKLINKLTVRELKAEEVFTFNVILCDNEVDRDSERFDIAALEKLAELFVGVTGIFDHNPCGGNQTARIFDTVCEKVTGKMTSFGEGYACVKAKAYMPRTVKNADLIAEIEAGIKKEVSVSCAVSTFTCSICGEDMRDGKCKHIRGRRYGDKICSCILSDVTDAYEWSFVAIPAQVNAGVTKGFGDRFKDCENLIKAVREGKCVKFTREQASQLCEYIEALEADALDGRLFRKSLTDEAVRFALIAVPELDRETVINMCSTAQTAELIKMKDAFRLKAGEIIPLSPQLKAKKEKPKTNNNDFKF
ncbi:MAG: hypothetical protein IJC13_02060 [Clostridia bacterium]|nr:hypothetical protein [Clostridia bacterium]